MRMPLLYSETDDGKLYAGPAAFTGGRVSLTQRVGIASVDEIKPREHRGQVILVDSVSVSEGEFNTRLVECCRVPGNDVWLIETVRDEADILDAFLPGLARLVIPLHTVDGIDVMKGAYEMSNGCVPLVVCRGGRTVDGKDPLEQVRRMAAIGFPQAMVADLDGSLAEDVWHRMSYNCSLVSYVPGAEPPEADVEAVDVFPVTARAALRRSPSPSSRRRPFPRCRRPGPRGSRPTPCRWSSRPSSLSPRRGRSPTSSCRRT